jgi:hypothetical protein
MILQLIVNSPVKFKVFGRVQLEAITLFSKERSNW